MTKTDQQRAIVSICVDIRPDAKSAFTDWQAELNAKILTFPGFVSLEFLSPTKSQKNWLVVQRFTDNATRTAWRESDAMKAMFAKVKTLAKENGVEEIFADESTIRNGVTEVFVTEVTPENEQKFLDWSAKIHQTEANFPGFRGVYMQCSAKSRSKQWITLLQFDAIENLDRWVDSRERKELISEAEGLVASMETHRVISPYAGWFSTITKTGAIIPVWKQTMVVLLVLFPIVMLELKYLSPLLSSLNLSISTFIGNAISVSLISFPMMPIAIWSLHWWLSPDKEKAYKYNLLGTILLIFLYLFEIIIFSYSG